MASPSQVIHVPKTPRSSFNPNRLLVKNTLLKHQVEHFRVLEEKLPPEQQTSIDFASIQTEGQAAEYIRKMTAILCSRAAKSGGR